VDREDACTPSSSEDLTEMDQLILAANDVVTAWDNHTIELEAAIRRLAEVLRVTVSAPEDDRTLAAPAA
jgi:hypothetical protein